MKDKINQKRKFISVSIRRDLVKRMRDMHISLQPKMDASGFFDDLLDFYEAGHCPQCQAVTVKRCRHHCTLDNA